MPKKRALSPQPEAEGSEREAFLSLINEGIPEPSDTPDDPPFPEISDPPPESQRTVEDYLRRQVRMEMYGTEEPTDYEKALSALKNRL